MLVACLHGHDLIQACTRLLLLLLPPPLARPFFRLHHPHHVAVYHLLLRFANMHGTRPCAPSPNRRSIRPRSRKEALPARKDGEERYA